MDINLKLQLKQTNSASMNNQWLLLLTGFNFNPCMDK